MTKSKIRLVQRQLKARRLYRGPIDGVYGEGTLRAIVRALERQGEGVPAGWPLWSKRRRFVAFVQVLCREQGIDVGPVDGYWGPQTDYAYGVLQFFLEHGRMPDPWRDVEPSDANPNRWPQETDRALTRHYGPVGENQTRVQLPYTHRLAWNRARRVNSFLCHERVHDSLARVLNRVLGHYGEERIKTLRLDLWGGCLNVRRKRGGTRWSTHAWGIAVDYDPERNPLQAGRDRAAFARPEYDKWWALWEEEGWVSLGRTANFDWMHIQAARR